MKKYFIHLYGRQAGPYTFEELRNMRIQPTTPVWFDGLGNWKNAGDVLELKGLFTSNPQTFYQQQTFTNPSPTRSTFTSTNLSGTVQKDNTSRNVIIMVVVIMVLVFAGIGSFVYYKQQKEREAEQVLRDIEYEEQARADAQAYADTSNMVVDEVAPTEDYGSSVYSGRFNNYSGGILTVKGSGTSDLEVKLEYNSADGCSGSVSGTAHEIEDHKIKMRTSDGCSLNIRYSTGFVEIEESGGCSSAHGSDCSFDGIYSKEH